MKGIIFALFCVAWGVIVSEAGVYRIKRNNIRPMGLPLRRAGPASVILRAATDTTEDREETKLPLPQELEDSLIVILMEGPNGFLQVLTIPLDELSEPIKGVEKAQQPGRVERVGQEGNTDIRSLVSALKDLQQPGQRLFLAKSDEDVVPVEEDKAVKPPPLVIFLLQDSLEGQGDETPSEGEGGELDVVMLIPIEEAAEKKSTTRWMPLQALGKRKRPVRTSPTRDDRLTAYLNSLRAPFIRGN